MAVECDFGLEKQIENFIRVTFSCICHIICKYNIHLHVEVCVSLCLSRDQATIFSYNHFREMEVFPKFHSVPFSKILTLFRKSPFVLIAGCGDPDADYNQKSDTISQFQI